MNRFFITMAIIFTALFCAAAHAGGPFKNWTLEYVPSPNLEPGCATHIGPGCDPALNLPMLDQHGCYPNEVWKAQCSAPVIVIWEIPPDLPPGCPNRAGPGCQPATGAPLTDQACFLYERFILLDATRPWLSGYCMRRAAQSINASKPAPILEYQTSNN